MRDWERPVVNWMWFFLQPVDAFAVTLWSVGRRLCFLERLFDRSDIFVFSFLRECIK